MDADGMYMAESLVHGRVTVYNSDGDIVGYLRLAMEPPEFIASRSRQYLWKPSPRLQKLFPSAKPAKTGEEAMQSLGCCYKWLDR